MNLTAQDRAFIEKRKKLLNAWPWAGGGLLVMLAGFTTWLWIRVPMMINPWAAMEAIGAGTMEATTLTLMAVMLPILVLAVMGVLAVVVTLLFVALSNERRLIAMIEREVL
jgi:hypothetical protein